MEFGLSKRVDGIIAELKAVGFMSPKLSYFAETVRFRAPVYELNPSVFKMEARA